MSNFPVVFNTNDEMTADYFNQVQDAILVRLEGIPFDQSNLTGNQTVLTHNVAVDKDEVLRLDAFLLVRVLTVGSITAALGYADVTSTGDINETTIVSADGVFPWPCQSVTIKAKRGTQVTIAISADNSSVYDLSGSLIILKSVS